jgi:hypothetical protein
MGDEWRWVGTMANFVVCCVCHIGKCKRGGRLGAWQMDDGGLGRVEREGEREMNLCGEALVFCLEGLREPGQPEKSRSDWRGEPAVLQ